MHLLSKLAIHGGLAVWGLGAVVGCATSDDGAASEAVETTAEAPDDSSSDTSSEFTTDTGAADSDSEATDEGTPGDTEGEFVQDVIDDILDSSEGSAGDGQDAGVESDTTPSAAPTPDVDGSGGNEALISPADLSPSERYITSWSDTRLVFEVDSVPGMEPHAAAEADLVQRFSALLDKPDGIEIIHDDVLEARGSGYEWTPDELFEYSSSHFDDDQPEGTVSMHVVFVDGRYVSPTGGTVLGVAWGGRFIAMFSETIQESCSQLPLLAELEADACRAAEFGVWSHEVGHVLGLVNNGLEMQTPHEDPEHVHHDVEEGCLMYWAYDGPSFVDAAVARLGAGDEEIDFCDGSLEDVAALRAAPAP